MDCQNVSRAGHQREVTLDGRQALVGTPSTSITLDGVPARISGFLNDFATVCRADGKGGRVEFAWTTAKRIVESHGRFES